MDIKLMKNNSQYSNGKNSPFLPPTARNRNRAKNMLLILLAALLLISYICIYQMTGFSKTLNRSKDPDLSKEDFITAIKEDPMVSEQMTRYARNLNRFYIHHRNFKTTPDSQKISDEDIQNELNILIEESYVEGHRVIDEYYTVLYDINITEDESIAAFGDFLDTVINSSSGFSAKVEKLKKDKLAEEKENYYGIEQYLNETNEFRYYLLDSSTGKRFHNLEGQSADIFDDPAQYVEDSCYYYVDLGDIDDLFNGVPLNESFAKEGIEGIILVPIEQMPGSFVTKSAAYALESFENNVNFANEYIQKYGILLAASLIFSAIIIKVIINLTENRDIELFGLYHFQKIPLILKAAAVVFTIQLMTNFIKNPTSLFNYHRFDSALAFMSIAFLSIMMILALFCLRYLLYLLKNIKMLKQEPEIRFLRKSYGDLITMRKFSPYLLPILCLIILGGIFLMLLGCLLIYLNYFHYIIMIEVLLPFLFFIVAIFAFMAMKIIVNYAKLGVYIDDIAQGNYTEVPSEKGMFIQPINKLNDLSYGLQKSLDEMLKSERTKTELITNVSHDLKTPLTSIINYVELLSKCNLQNETEREYVEVLRQKSQRLKLLIEDLFEAAKLSSSSIELLYNRGDVVQLIEQTMGELSEKIEKSNLDFRFSANPEHIFLRLDGKKMWRVFENLLNNIIKYSKEGTRVYITVESDGKTVEIVMKNISNYELDFDPNELFERFKRGDKARSTEGSGLGLSIARNIIELHGGKMDIAIDGDLFKVSITLDVDLEQ